VLELQKSGTNCIFPQYVKTLILLATIVYDDDDIMKRQYYVNIMNDIFYNKTRFNKKYTDGKTV